MVQQHRTIIALGSNTDPRHHIAAALAMLGRVVEVTAATRQLETAPIGMDSPNFVNQLVKGETRLAPDQLEAAIKQIERDLGRDEADRGCHVVRIDIDILEYDGQRHHQRDWERDYIKQLMREL